MKKFRIKNHWIVDVFILESTSFQEFIVPRPSEVYIPTFCFSGGQPGWQLFPAGWFLPLFLT